MQSRFYIADDIQTLSDGKTLMVGVYTDALILVNLPKDEKIKPTPEAPVAMPTLALLVALSDLKPQEGIAESRLTNPDGSTGPALKAIKFVSSPNRSVNLLVKFAPFLISQEGKYTWTIKIDGAEVVSTFHIQFREI